MLGNAKNDCILHIIEVLQKSKTIVLNDIQDISIVITIKAEIVAWSL